MASTAAEAMEGDCNGHEDRRTLHRRTHTTATAEVATAVAGRRNSACGVRQRAWVSYCLTRERQGRGRLTRHTSIRRAGETAVSPATRLRMFALVVMVARGPGCRGARSACRQYRRRHAYAWAHRWRYESEVAGEVTRWRRAQRAEMRERRAAAGAGGGTPPKSSQRAVWSGHLNRIRRPERSEEGGCKVVTPKHMKKGGVGGCYNPPLGCNN